MRSGAAARAAGRQRREYSRAALGVNGEEAKKTEKSRANPLDFRGFQRPGADRPASPREPVAASRPRAPAANLAGLASDPMPLRGPVLALDYGTRRIGLAVSDPDGRFAFPAGVLTRRSLARDLAALDELARERAATRLLIGLPLHLDGRRGPEAQAVQRFAEALGEATGLPVELLDERWTTLEAERALRQTVPDGRRRREKVDAAAAAILLRTWLEREQRRAAP